MNQNLTQVTKTELVVTHLMSRRMTCVIIVGSMMHWRMYTPARSIWHTASVGKIVRRQIQRCLAAHRIFRFERCDLLEGLQWYLPVGKVWSAGSGVWLLLVCRRSIGLACEFWLQISTDLFALPTLLLFRQPLRRLAFQILQWRDIKCELQKLIAVPFRRGKSIQRVRIMERTWHEKLNLK